MVYSEETRSIGVPLSILMGLVEGQKKLLKRLERTEVIQEKILQHLDQSKAVMNQMNHVLGETLETMTSLRDTLGKAKPAHEAKPEPTWCYMIDMDPAEVLIEACEAGDEHHVNAILKDRRCDVTANHWRAFHRACQKGHTRLLTPLLHHRSVKPTSHLLPDVLQDALWAASATGQTATVDFLLRRCDPTVNDQAAFVAACENGHAAVVERYLQDRRIDPALADNTALQRACEAGHPDVVATLLRSRWVDPTVHTFRLIRSAARQGAIRLLILFLEDPRVDPSRHDALCVWQEACWAEQPEVLAMLHRDFPQTVPDVATRRLVFAQACGRGCVQVVKWLMQHVADVCVPHLDDNRALKEASKQGQLAVVRVLMQDRHVEGVYRCKDDLASDENGQKRVHWA